MGRRGMAPHAHLVTRSTPTHRPAALVTLDKPPPITLALSALKYALKLDPSVTTTDGNKQLSTIPAPTVFGRVLVLIAIPRMREYYLER